MSSRISRGMEGLIEARHAAGPAAVERDMPELERALLRRGMNERNARHKGCARCCRTPLVGERVYVAATGETLCALCQSHEADPPAHSSVVHVRQSGRSRPGKFNQRAATDGRRPRSRPSSSTIRRRLIARVT